MIREVVKATGDIFTVAGNGTLGYSGDDGPATAAALDYPKGVAVDAAGDLFIADSGNDVIREVVMATGDIITVAGNGKGAGTINGGGYSGDNGPATDAELNTPTGVAVDAAGDLFIADAGNSVVRQTTPAVTVTIGVLKTATFLGADSTTQGSWIGVYGSQGSNVINATNGVNYPSYATVTPAGNTPYTWAANTNQVQALQNPSGSGRIAAAWYSATSFTVDVDLTDGLAHNLELYLLDYDTTSRTEQIQFTDADTHALLSTQTVSSFQGGVYMKYTIAGNVLITITYTGGPVGVNAVLSGLFFDPSTTTPGSTTTTSVGSSLNPSTAGQAVTFTATVSDTSGGVPTGSVEFYEGSTKLGPGSALSGSGTSATSTLTTSTLIPGSQSISAVYTPTGTFAGSSGSVTQTVNTPPATTTFLGDDSTTEGSWIGVYGSQGYNVINATNGVAYPSYAIVTPACYEPFTWAANTTQVQALQNPSGSGRIAACWYSGTSFTVDVELTDGQAHNLELYLLDYDTTSRTEQIQFTDADTHAVLSTQTVSSFQGGVYMNYTISGNVLITITYTGGPAGVNAVLSGLFFDPSTTTPGSTTTTSVGSSLNPSTSGQAVTFTATVSDTSGGVPTGSVEFYEGSTDLGPGSALSGSGNSATSTLTTSTLIPGSQSISAIYTPTGTFAGSSGSVTQTVNTPPATTTFLGDDTTTEGSWIGVYGSQGYNVINATNGVAYPSYAIVTPTRYEPFIWAANTTQVQALQNPSGSGRIAAAWYATRASRWTWS